MNMSGHQVRLEARNQGLSYCEDGRLLRFDLSRQGRTWLVQLPPTGDQFKPVVLSEREVAAVLPRIEKFLSRIWWFGVWPVRYKVVFSEEVSNLKCNTSPEHQRS